MFLLSQGLDLFQINLVNLVFFITLFLCEIPTGAFADVFGRKTSFVASCVISMFAMLMYAFSRTFWGFAIAEILAAIASTFISGAFDAWFVDKLKHHGYRESLTPVFARATQLATGAGLVAAVAGAMLFDIWITLPWFLGSIIFAITGTTAFLVMKEEYFVREPLSLEAGLVALKQTVISSIAYGLRNKNIRFIMLLVLALNFTTMAPNMQWQPFFKQWTSSQTSLGILWITMAFSLMAGSWLAPYALRYISERRVLLLCHIVTATGITGTVLFGLFPAALAMFLLHEVGRGAFVPIKTAYLHDNVPSKERATVVSFEAISHHVGGAIGLVVSGALAQYGSITCAWVISGGALFLMTILLSKNDR